MKNFALSLTLTLCLSSMATAQCFADYKAKQDNPLRLHYGVAKISGPCSVANAKSELAHRIAINGWTVLKVMSVFGSDGLDQRKDSAGQYYLRF